MGNIRQTWDKNGNIAAAQDYYSYGEILRSYNASSGFENYKYTSKERDAESNLDYFGARYYESLTGRWMQVDPLSVLNPSLSPYNYCFNNPLNFVDPNGLWGDSVRAHPEDYLWNGNYILGQFGIYEYMDANVTGSSNSNNVSNGSGGGKSAASAIYGISGAAGIFEGGLQNTIANDYFILGKNWKFHKTGRGLNQWTGSEGRAKAIAKPILIVGGIIFLTRAGLAYIDLRNNFNWNKFAIYGNDLGLDAISFVGLPGWGVIIIYTNY